ncbi:MAG: SPOR domain-containing protein [Gammaproteobacteria bacterium]|nr:SPOR domain-containing protein [Gammaproteobacteria bacterium]
MSEAKNSSPWVWISLVLIIGLFVAFILFLDQNIVKSGRQENQAVESTGVNTKPVFDFYTVLPNRTMDIPESSDNQPNVPNISNKKKSSADRFVVQVGSFQKMQDADRRKAELAFLGLQSSIKQALVKGSTYYRVEMGPLSESQYSKIQKNLIANNIDFFAKNIP